MPAIRAAVPLSALLALILGTLVYLLDRDWSSTLFLSPVAAWQPARLGVFGVANLFLPSLFHAYAFALLIACAAGCTPSARLSGAMGWFAVAACLECLQALDIDPVFFDGVGRYAGRALSGAIQIYIENGRFDVGDILAAALGCLAAYTVAGIPEKHK